MLEIRKPGPDISKPVIRQANIAEFLAYEDEIQANQEDEEADLNGKV